MSTLLLLHIVFCLISYIIFLVASITGFMFLIQDDQLKRKSMGILFNKIPSLGFLEQVNYACLKSGFIFLSLGLMIGIVYAKLKVGTWWTWDPKELLTLLLWSTYLTLLIYRMKSYLRGRKIALSSILGFTLVLFTYWGVNRLFPTWHNYQ